jgi:hypothetical protein
VISRVIPDAPHQIVLVLDGNTGQNGIAQVLAFRNAIGLQGIIITKLDGTAKGGVICALSKALVAPIESEPIRSKTFVYLSLANQRLSLYQRNPHLQRLKRFLYGSFNIPFMGLR